MFNQLYKLFKHTTEKTPLEDYTTEVFVGILNLDQEIKESFCRKFLELPNDDYRITTQVKYDLSDDINCRIDIEIKGDKTICFIENKVNSKEGLRQLERYAKVLDSRHDENKFLVYCTKFSEEKSLTEHGFRHIRWFQIADFLKEYNGNKVISDFLDFLKSKDMAQDLTLSAKDFITLENLKNTILISKGHLDRVKAKFVATFKSEKKVSDGIDVTQISKHNRLIYYYTQIVDGSYSDIKYGIQLETPNIYVSIWLNKSNKYHDKFKTLAKTTSTPFIVVELPEGTALELKQDISIYLNDDEADDKIAKWFRDAFEKLADFIRENDSINWKIKCPEKK